MLRSMRLFSWLSFVGCAHGTFDASEFPEMEQVNDWITQATRSASTIGDDFQRKIPYIIVAGDQGVGKSSTINRLVQEELFPMRSKSKAEKDEPQTKVATLYTVARSEGAESVKVETRCADNACKRADCGLQEVSKEDLAKKIDKLQSNCFKGFFGVDDLIMVHYSMPTAISIQIVDLPGIQQSGSDKIKSKKLTEHWFVKQPNSIILACLRAGQMFQQEIYGMLEENVDKYVGRVIFVITKPNSLAEDNLSVLKMIKSDKMGRFDAVGVILKGSDTSDAEEAKRSIQVQAEKEREWFQNHPAYKGEPDMWGIGTLQDLTHRAYLRIACSYLPKLRQRLQHEAIVHDTQLKEMPHVESIEALLMFVTEAWKKTFEEDIRNNEAMEQLTDIYARYKAKQVDLGKDALLFDGIPQPGYSPGLQCDHPFFGGAPGETGGWMGIAHSLVQEVRAVVHKAAMRTAGTTFKSMTKMSSMNVGAADHVIKKISSCDHADAIMALSHVVCSFVFATGEKQVSISEHLEMVRDPNQLPSVLIRMVMQMCIWEPLQNLTQAVRSPETQDGLRRALDLSRFNQAKIDLKAKVDSYHALLSRDLPCSDQDILPLQENEPSDAEFFHSSPQGCGLVGSIFEGSTCRCMEGLEGELVKKGERWEGKCIADVSERFTTGKEKLWKKDKKEFKCCIVQDSPERTKIQDMNVDKLPDTRGMMALWKDGTKCGSMFGKNYHNGPSHFNQCKAPLKTLMVATGGTFEDVMGMLGMRVEL